MKSQSVTNITLLTIFFMAIITAVTLNSCQKETVKPKTTNALKSKAVTGNPTASAAQVLNEVMEMVFSSSKPNSNIAGKLSATKTEKGLGQNLSVDTTGGVIVTYDTLNKPDSVVYNYGTGCTGKDGLTRSGIVIMTYDNTDIRVINNTFAVTLQNYSVSGFQATNLYGTLSYTNIGPNQAGNLVIAETGGYTGVSGSSNDTLTANYQYEWLAGETSSPLSNLQFRVTGVTYGSGEGLTAVDTITAPLIKNCKTPGCNFYIQGMRYSAVNGTLNVKITDYDNPGGCSGQMEVTENGSISIVNQ